MGFNLCILKPYGYNFFDLLFVLAYDDYSNLDVQIEVPLASDSIQKFIANRYKTTEANLKN
jgi:hypothetical protein